MVEDSKKHERYAESILLEMRDKDGIFDFVVYKESFDQIGIDWVAGIFVEAHGKQKELRLFIQHKSSEESAAFFVQRNPCVILWIVRCSSSSLEAKISLLENTIEWLSRIPQNPNTIFFEEKLKKIKGFLQNTPPIQV